MRWWTHYVVRLSSAGLFILSGCGGSDDAASDVPPAASPTSSARSGPTDTVAVDTVVVPSPLAGAHFVPDQDCRECHLAEAAGFDESGMSRTFARAVPGNMIEPLDGVTVSHAPSGREYEVNVADDQIVVTRFQRDDDGTRYNELAIPMEYVIGSGVHSRTYLYGNDADELYQMPIAWHGQINDGAGGWDMHGGFFDAAHQGFRRKIPRECFGCHSAYPALGEGEDQFGFPDVFPGIQADAGADGIGCQRCHGPGSDHLRIVEDLSASEADIRASIHSLADMDAVRAADVCLSCHLQPASNLASRNTRFGLGDYSFRPGDAIQDHIFHVAFGDEDELPALFEANHHPYRLNMSACFRESEPGAFTCLTCHDPHHRPAPPDRAAHYAAKCYSCHAVDDCMLEAMQSGDRAGLPDVEPTDCVACHMPKRRAQDLVREVVTEHFIARRHPAKEKLLAPIPEAHSVFREPSPYFGEDRRPSPAEVEAQLALIQLRETPTPDILARLTSALRDADMTVPEPRLYEARASARTPAELASAMATLVADYPDRPLIAYEHGKALLAAGSVDEAAAVFTRLRSAHPRLPEAAEGLALVARARGDHAGVVKAARAAIGLRPQFVDARRMEAFALRDLGQPDAALAAFTDLLRWEPAATDAHLASAVLHMRAGRPAIAARNFSRAVRERPADAGFREGQIAMLAISGQGNECLVAIEEARARSLGDPVVLAFAEAIGQELIGSRSAATDALTRARQMSARVPARTMARQLIEREATRIFGSQ